MITSMALYWLGSDRFNLLNSSFFLIIETPFSSFEFTADLPLTFGL